MASVTVVCSACKAKLAVPSPKSGGRLKCPKCRAFINAPSQTVADTPSYHPLQPQTVPDPPTSDNSDPLLESQAAPPDRSSKAAKFLRPAQAANELGHLGHFRVLQELGHGGMGVVYLAEDIRLLRHVALKCMLPEYASRNESRERFLREARTAASIDNDHIIAIFEVNEDNGVPFLTMPVLKGESLSARLKKAGPLAVAEVLRIGREICDGLAAAHGRGLVHRDLKPGNIWLEGTRRRVKILDFGLARAVSDDGHLTKSGIVLGTPAYMAPEQARDPHVDGRADLFSLGVVLFQLAVGKLPFRGHDSLSHLLSICNDPPPDPKSLRSDLPPEFNTVILKLLEKEPSARFQSAEETGLAIEAVERLYFATAPTLAGESRGAMSVPVATPVTAAMDEESVNEELVFKQTQAIVSLSSAEVMPRPKPAMPPRRPAAKKAIAAGFFGFVAAMILVGGIVIRITYPDGTKKEIHVPEGGEAVIFPKPKEKKSGDDKKLTVAKKNVPNEESEEFAENRRVARLLRPTNGLVLVLESAKPGEAIELGPNDGRPLPAEPFRIVGIRQYEIASKKLLFDSISKLISLRAIDVWSGPVWERSDLELVSRQPCASNLTDIGLAETQLTQDLIEVLKRFPKLGSLRINCRNANDQILLSLVKGLPSLTALTLIEPNGKPERGGISLNGLENIGNLPLANFSLLRGTVSKEWCKLIATFPSSNLSMACEVDNQGLAELAKSQLLERLFIGGGKVNDSGLQVLRDHPSLKDISLAGELEVSEKCLVNLSDSMLDCTIRWKGGEIPARSRLPESEFIVILKSKTPAEIRRLRLPTRNLTPELLEAIKRFQNVESIQISFHGADDSLLRSFGQEFSGLTDLRIENFQQSRVSPMALGTLVKLKKLNLWVSGMESPASWLKSIASLPNLEELYINCHPAGDACARELSDCPKLRRLTFAGNITDAGLKSLAKIATLRELDIRESFPTEHQVTALSSALPACRIVWQGGVVGPKQAEK